jgi:hypothetical protein
MAALKSLEEAWNALAGGGGGGDAKAFWKKRGPDLRTALPLRQSLSPSSPAQDRYIKATIIDPDPPVNPEREEEIAGDLLFGPWFITETRKGIDGRACYSYLDLRGCLYGIGGDEGGGIGAPGETQSGEANAGDPDRGAECYWTHVKVSVWKVVATVLSTELDLAVVISCVLFIPISVLVSYFNFLLWDEKRDNPERQYQEEGGRPTTTHLTVRPLCLRDGTPHSCAKVPTMRFSVTGNLEFSRTQAQVLGDYLLLWTEPFPSQAGYRQGEHRMSRLYLIAWKQGSITLVCVHLSW